MLSIPEAANELKLSYIKENYQTLFKEMTHRQLTIEEALMELLSEEVELRRSRSHQRRIKDAKFQQKKYLFDFDDQLFEPTVRQQLRELKTLEFIKNKENAILIGNPGTGKTHYSIGIGIEACLQGYSVLFMNAPNLVIQMKEAVTQSQFV